MLSKKNSEKLLDKQIEEAQKQYAITHAKLTRLGARIHSLFEKRYPQGRYYDEFRDEANIKRTPLDSSGR